MAHISEGYYRNSLMDKFLPQQSIANRIKSFTPGQFTVVEDANGLLVLAGRSLSGSNFLFPLVQKGNDKHRDRINGVDFLATEAGIAIFNGGGILFLK